MGDQLELECVSCIICGKDDASAFIQGPGGTNIVRCRNDGLIYLNPRPTSAHVRESFTGWLNEDNVDTIARVRRGVLQREARAIKKLKSGGSLVDIGCASGTFFENFDPSNWRLYGVETSPVGVEIAGRGAEVFCGTLREARYPSGSFDVVTILDTLYYIPDPKAELVEIRRILKDDGVLAVEIPGLAFRLLRMRGPFCWLLDRRWTSGFVWTHLYYFSPTTLRLLLETIGFRVVDVIPEQASLGRQGMACALNDLHFALARLLFKVTAGTLAIAAKELYLATKVR